MQPENTYNVYSGANITDVAGNTLYGLNITFTTGTGQVTTGPTVTTLTPPNGATGVPINAQVSALMSAPIDPTSLTSSSITVKQGTTVISGTVTLSADALTLLWVPAGNLATSTTYSVQVSGISDQSGNPATASNTTFTTGSSGTVVGPGSLTLVSVTPTSGSVGVSNTAPVVVTFSEVVNPTTVPNMTVYVTPPGAYVSGSWAVNPGNQAQATFTPAQPYPASANVIVSTGNRVKDYAGNTDTIGTVTSFTVGTTEIRLIRPLLPSPH